MCQIFYCRAGIPSERLLDHTQKQHDDGIGCAWLTQDPKDKKRRVVAWKKGMNLEQLNTFLEGFRAAPPEVAFPLIIHFRAASSGYALPELTHPFPLMDGIPDTLEGYGDAVLFQNGTWKEWYQELRLAAYGTGIGLGDGESDWNDTRALAYIAHHYGEGMLQPLTESHPMRILTMRANRRFPVMRWGKWIDGQKTEDGKDLLWYQSNETSGVRIYGYQSHVWDEEWEEQYGPVGSSSTTPHDPLAEELEQLSMIERADREREARAASVSHIRFWSDAELLAILAHVNFLSENWDDSNS